MNFRRRRQQPRSVLMQVIIRGREVSLQGVLMSTRPIGGVYVLVNAKLIETTQRSHSSLGAVEIPAGNVAFWQVLNTVAATDVRELVAATDEQEA